VSIPFVNTTQKQDIRSYLNPFPPRFSEAAQAGILTGTIYKEDKTGKVFDALARSVRKGTIVEVADGFLLAPIRGQTRKRREAMLERIDAIRERGGIIKCLATGYQSNERAQCNRMLLRAYEMMGRSGKGVPGKRKEGRPPTEVTQHEKDVMEGIWHSRRYKNNDERVTAIEKRIGWSFGATELRKRYGPPGGREVAEA